MIALFRRMTSCVILLSFFSIDSVHTQSYEFALGIGSSMYGGDLNSPSFGNNVAQSKGAFDVKMERQLNDYLGFNLGLLYGKVSGDDSYASSETQKERNLSFFSHIAEISLSANYYIFGFDYEQEGRFFTPYLTAGISAFHFNPKTIYQGQTYKLQPLGTEGQGIQGKPKPYKLFQGAIHFGGGAKVRINKKVALSTEINIRFTSTDYLDDVSTNYVSFDDLYFFNGETSAILSQRIDEYNGKAEGSFPGNYAGKKRGNPEVNDYYFMGMIRFHYNLGKTLFYRIDCPKL